MVRLKAEPAVASKATIPAFQFLMVRLKVENNLYSNIIKNHFNSLWCD